MIRIINKSAIDAPSDPIYKDQRMFKFHDISAYLIFNDFNNEIHNTIQEMLMLSDCPYVELTLGNSP